LSTRRVTGKGRSRWGSSWCLDGSNARSNQAMRWEPTLREFCGGPDQPLLRKCRGAGDRSLSPVKSRTTKTDGPRHFHPPAKVPWGGRSFLVACQIADHENRWSAPLSSSCESAVGRAIVPCRLPNRGPRKPMVRATFILRCGPPDHTGLSVKARPHRTIFKCSTAASRTLARSSSQVPACVKIAWPNARA
jgi:hypothetical protein